MRYQWLKILYWYQVFVYAIAPDSYYFLKVRAFYAKEVFDWIASNKKCSIDVLENKELICYTCKKQASKDAFKCIYGHNPL